IICYKSALEIIDKECIHFYIRENFIKKRFLENYVNVAYDYYVELEEKGTLNVYYISDSERFKQFYAIANKTKRAITVSTLE
ncbi:type IV pili, partial [Francisella tularensis subsp. holarctica]|nr:type IV pili [Francisella tularensis subsp. holarctica]